MVIPFRPADIPEAAGLTDSPIPATNAKAMCVNDLLHPESVVLNTAERELPWSVEAEQAILGGLLRDNSAWVKISDQVGASDFFRADHQLIFNALSRLAENGQALDVVTLQDALTTEGVLDSAGGLSYLIELYRHTPSVANIVAYARVVSERAKLRHIVHISTSIAKSALHPAGKSADDLVHEAEQLILSVAGSRPKEGGAVSLEHLLGNAVRTIETLNEAGGEAVGLSTGFDDIDRKLNYLRPADLVIIAGRPSMGKTTFAMNIVESAVLRSEKVVVVYSLEMPGESLVMRMLSSLGRIDHTRLKSGKLHHDDWPKLTKAANLISKGSRLFIDDTAGLSPSEMRSRTRRIRRANGEIGLIMVDYLQLMQVPCASGNSRTNEISEISRSLKALAKEFNCPVVALSQLNRSLEQRANKRPINSDLRESGAIEQDADVIMFVYRDEVYNPDSKYRGSAEIIIGKQREGPTGFVRLGFIDRYTRFESLDPATHGFSDAEMGYEPRPPDPRQGRSRALELATAVKEKRGARSPRMNRKGSRRPP